MSKLSDKYRPDKLAKVFGNEEVVSSLQKAVDEKDIPQVILFTGPTGCGKTTLGRIVANELGAAKNLTEMDSAQFNGVDTIRDIRKNSRYVPIGGGTKVYLMDECFHKDTLITLQDGSHRPISEIKVGDYVSNLVGIGQVKNTFINKVPLNRLVRIKFSNNKEVYCSDAHEFMTETGWCFARDLKNNFVFLQNSRSFMSHINLLSDVKKKNKTSKVSGVWWGIKCTTKEILQFILFSKKKWKKSSEGSINTESVPDMQEGLSIHEIKKSSNLWTSMWERISRTEKNWVETHKRNKGDSQTKKISFCENERRKKTSKRIFNSDAGKESYARKEEYKENDENKGTEWNFARFLRRKRREWELNETTNAFSKSANVGNGSSNPYKRSARKHLPNKLQSRHRQQEDKSGNRSRWKGTQFEKSQIERRKEREEIERVRVESVTFYKSENNEKSFEGIIKDKERNQGFINLYDFEVSEHHSYFANDILVHNCHMLSRNAQEAFLKELEEPPKHVNYILCTTNPEKLIKTLRGRCIEYNLDTLSEDAMLSLLKKVVKKEKEELSKKVYKIIVKNSKGHPRNALNILQQVLSVSDKQRLKIAEKSELEENESINLCRSLLQRKGYNDAKVILNGLKTQDAEGIRRHILGYCQSVLLGNDWKGSHVAAAAIMEEFREPTYDMGFSAIVLACFSYYNAD
jgi:DNA polymerase III gamma/tau subunit